MASGSTVTPDALERLLAQVVVNLGGTAPTSGGLGELVAAVANAINGFVPGGGQPASVLGPTGATAETIPRALGAESVTIAVASGTLYLQALYIPANTVVNNLNFVVGTTGSTGVSHNWAALYNSSRVLLAISGDNTSADVSANSLLTYAVANVAAGAASSFTTTYSGLYYIGFMIATGTTQPTMVGVTSAGSTLNNLTPKLAGTSNTGLTTPQTFPTTATAITASASELYAFTS